MKTGDLVKIVGPSLGGRTSDIDKLTTVKEVDECGDHLVEIGGIYSPSSLELVIEDGITFPYGSTVPKMRTFDTGATRSSDAGKLDFEGFLSPIVLERYAQYLNKHRTQADGQIRDSDNWQKGISKEVYLKSAFRHFIDVWKQHRGYKGQDTLQDSLCAVLFNIQGYLFEDLKDESIHQS